MIPQYAAEAKPTEWRKLPAYILQSNGYDQNSFHYDK